MCFLSSCLQERLWWLPGFQPSFLRFPHQFIKAPDLFCNHPSVASWVRKHREHLAFFEILPEEQGYRQVQRYICIISTWWNPHTSDKLLMFDVSPRISWLTSLYVDEKCIEHLGPNAETKWQEDANVGIGCLAAVNPHSNSALCNCPHNPLFDSVVSLIVGGGHVSFYYIQKKLLAISCNDIHRDL